MQAGFRESQTGRPRGVGDGGRPATAAGRQPHTRSHPRGSDDRSWGPGDDGARPRRSRGTGHPGLWGGALLLRTSGVVRVEPGADLTSPGPVRATRAHHRARLAATGDGERAPAGPAPPWCHAPRGPMAGRGDSPAGVCAPAHQPRGGRHRPQAHLLVCAPQHTNDEVDGTDARLTCWCVRSSTPTTRWTAPARGSPAGVCALTQTRADERPRIEAHLLDCAP